MGTSTKGGRREYIFTFAWSMAKCRPAKCPAEPHERGKVREIG